MSKYKNINRFFKMVFDRHKSIAYLSLIIMIIISVFDLLIPQITRAILDDAINKGRANLLIKLILVYAFISLASAAFTVLLEYISSSMKKSVSVRLKIKLLHHLSKLSGEYYTNIKTGNILSVVETDLFIVENLGAEIIFSLIINVITACVALFFLIDMNVDLLIIVIVLQIALTLSQSWFTNIIASKTEDIRHKDGELCNTVQEYVSNIMSIVISKSRFKFFKEYLHKERILLKKCINLDLIISSNVAISRILSSIVVLSIYGYGGLKIIEGNMTIGELIAFQQYTGMLIGPCISIIKSNTTIQQSLVSINRIFNILDEPIIIKHDNNGLALENNSTGDIVFSNVNFAYDNDKILENINIVFEKGKMTALVGPSGCGKSTIINLLFRLWDVNEGNITINGINIKDYKLNALRKNISIVTQDILLFDDSILNNLTLGNNSLSMEFIEDICKKVDIYNFINTLPDGFNTIVGESGVKLSGGQKQRIAIARSLMSSANIIIFDEATSALDNISQRNILENIRSLLENKTIIVIAHRLSTIKDADTIYIIERGMVTESGSHKELLSNESTYYKLTNEHRYDNNLNSV